MGCCPALINHKLSGVTCTPAANLNHPGIMSQSGAATRGYVPQISAKMETRSGKPICTGTIL
jgi:hypothetical protein